MDGSAQAFTEATANPSRLLDLTSVRRGKTVDGKGKMDVTDIDGKGTIGDLAESI